jgi:DNA repair protein RecN (Recombination protein N)
MLNSLRIRNIVLIDKLDLAFGQGLSVLTGETGAGKSILLDSLGLATGGRATSGLVRAGCDQGSVTATFEAERVAGLQDVLTEYDLPYEDTLILRRTLSADGKSKAYINDQPVSVSLLKAVGSLLVEIQGQFEQHGLLDVSTHLTLLDSFGGLTEKRVALNKAYQTWHEASQAYTKAQADLTQAQANEEYLRHAVNEFETLNPQPGEESDLADKRSLLQNQEKLLEALQQAQIMLTNDGGAEQVLRRSMRTLNNVADKAGERIEDILKSLDEALTSAQDASFSLESLYTELAESDLDIEAIEERLFALRALARKHQTTVDELPALADQMQAQLQALSHSTDHLADLQKAEARAKETYKSLAMALSTERQKAAQNFDAAVMAELPPLKLEKAEFVTQISPLAEENWGANGLDKGQFLCTTNPGLPPAPIQKVASGGELSRFLLALKVVLTRDSSPSTLIFDEVDSGVGGAVAAAVGERLARLSESVQVLVVTHSPQVAGIGETHFKVEKIAANDQSMTQVKNLDPAARQEEIARMLSGAHITDEARAQAQKLMLSKQQVG